MSAGGAHPAADELMDRVYRRQRHIYDLTRKYFLLGRDHLIRELRSPVEGSVVEIGCGTGRNLIAAARAYPDARLFGLDISAAMLATARANIRHAGLDGRVTLALGDAVTFDPSRLFGRSHFDRAFFSYSLSMIPAWREALSHALDAVTAPGGMVLAVDFGQQDRLPYWFRAALFAWLARFHVTPRPDLEPALHATAKHRAEACNCRPLYRGYAAFGTIAR